MRPRATAALWVGAAGFLTLFAVQLSLELIMFGWRWGFLTGERDLYFYLYPSGVSEIVAVNLIIAVAAAIPIAVLGAALLNTRIGPTILGSIWLALCMWALFGTASGYRAHFGATWRWYEPFWELMWHPVITPIGVILCFSAFMAVARKRL